MSARTSHPTTRQSAFFGDMRTALLAARRSIETRLRRQRAGAREPADDRTSGDDGQVQSTDGNVQQYVAFALMEASTEVLTRIDGALRRLDQGRYGRCADCDEAIAPVRLRALPFALRCLECERDREGASTPPAGSTTPTRTVSPHVPAR